MNEMENNEDEPEEFTTIFIKEEMNNLESNEDELEEFTKIFIKQERILPDEDLSEDVEVAFDIAVDPFQLNKGCSSASKESNIEISAPSSCVEQEAESKQCEELNSSDPLSNNIDKFD
ncbi:hypothetical protein LSTR_LSTR004525 [Laodelphax striatellus]|uniref:Uncharacterized protein n=1 Tax=Laodelphax striatellus TaxID=195883 RepID=A0A482XH89_LAOST|nr:hypothetical protein LSTR_LSTR004525 [Laodelphax striatellus]